MTKRGQQRIERWGAMDGAAGRAAYRAHACSLSDPALAAKFAAARDAYLLAASMVADGAKAVATINAAHRADGLMYAALYAAQAAEA